MAIYQESGCVQRRPWEVAFTAEPQAVPRVRRAVRLHLSLWGLSDLEDLAQLCVSELVANVINHIGVGTPVTLAVSTDGIHLRIELSDPDARAMPTLLAPLSDAESGRGLMILDAVSDRWGVISRVDSKAVWCELPTGAGASSGQPRNPRIAHAEMSIVRHGAAQNPTPEEASPLSAALAEKAAIDLIADVLHWLRAHGCDPDESLDRAQTRFEAQLEEIR
ncbi:ATP-binding protein [Streptomyces sp. NBC_01498]|uniref:ATP-binding protein n=1 Tax=Streptomyces sp. NBC_01498 TaxID=2975870 RepID=UPI002E7B88BA|nr:ATP-binding protein [Streptomyces sp. NBC_01498]WTL26708.1 ATP-binding protein [Streptomyces sp. NBC_01498]